MRRWPHSAAQQEWEATEAKWNHFVAEAGLQETGQNIKSALEILADELRASYERLKKALRHSARELQYIADDDPCDKCHQSGEGRACVALAERILGPMHTWPDEPNLSAPAEEDGRDA